MTLKRLSYYLTRFRLRDNIIKVTSIGQPTPLSMQHGKQTIIQKRKTRQLNLNNRK